MVKKNKIIKNFSRAAKTYEEYALLQYRIGIEMFSWIGKQINIKEILDIGCGTGKVTKKLAENFSANYCLGLDISDVMVNYAKDNNFDKRVEYLTTDFEKYSANRVYDLVFSNCSLQWFSDYKKTFNNIKNYMNEKGLLLFSFVFDNSFQQLKNIFFSNKKTVENRHSDNFFLIKLLAECDFEIINYKYNQEDIYFPDLISILKYIQKSGVGQFNDNSPLNITKKKIDSMNLIYQKKYGIDGVLPVNFNWGVFLCRKK
jgi:malonyl-CoA O-methyltransferase